MLWLGSGVLLDAVFIFILVEVNFMLCNQVSLLTACLRTFHTVYSYMYRHNYNYYDCAYSFEVECNCIILSLQC